ncbi:MAG: NADH-quinone oxidoreductase subunit C, partial [Candidatus Omnitrophica bacterium]|nr:NADH-quinone oxidoreductase subunit C [Candidatus Omnitrophota bacterium]
MTPCEKIIEELTKKFDYFATCAKIVRPRRISIEVKQENFLEVFVTLSKQLGFSHLCTITGLDEGEVLSFIYHLADTTGILINLKTSVPKERPILKSVIS